LFRQESFFQYLFGVKEPDWYGVIDVDTKRTTLFVPRLPATYAVWMGKILTPEEWRVHYEVDTCRFTDELDAFLQEARVSDKSCENG
jgi:Xaa-Pro dipeptidase